MKHFNTINNPKSPVLFNGFPVDELQFSLLDCGVVVKFQTKQGFTLIVTPTFKNDVDRDKEIKLDDISYFTLTLCPNRVDYYGVDISPSHIGDWKAKDGFELINLVYSGFELDCFNKVYSNV